MFQGTGGSVSATSPFFATILIGGAAILGAVLVIIALRIHNTSQNRFTRSIERSFRLRTRHRSLLRKLAHAAELPDTSSLLLVPSLFDKAVARLDPGVDELVEIEELRNRILAVLS